jgi:hypothetical protein
LSIAPLYSESPLIEVCRQHYVLVAQLGVGAAQDARNVLRFDVRSLDLRRRLEACGKGEARHRLPGVDQGKHLREGVPRAGKQCVGARGIHRQRQLLAGCFVERRIGQRHRRLQPCERGPLPRNVHALGVCDADRADGARRAVHLPSLAGRPEMRLQWSGQRPRRRRDVHDDRPLQIHAGKVVDAALGDIQAVPDEHQRRLDGWRRVDPQADRRVVAEFERLGASVAHEGEARLRFDDLAGLECHRLNVAVDAGGLEAGFLELGRHVVGGTLVRRAAGVASFHAVIGERFHVRKPARGRLVVGVQADGPRQHRHSRGREHSAHGS